MANNFFAEYMRYTEATESPRIYHRWCAISSAAAMLGRNVWFQHGHFNVYPNIFCMLIGDPGTRKSTAIKLAKKLLGESGYTTFAASKTSKEKFLLDLSGAPDEEFTGNGKRVLVNPGDILDDNLWGGTQSASTSPKEVFIMADEFNEFAGAGSVEFYDILGTLWDWDDDKRPYEHRYKSSQIRIHQPTVSIVAGNTPENFARAFPPEILGTGFMSRLLLIHGERTGVKIAFPTSPSAEATARLVELFTKMRTGSSFGKLELTAPGLELLGKIYNQWIEIEDTRFVTYSNRRFSHLLKLCVIFAGVAGEKTITYDTVIEANTVLSAAELKMPLALGEFGKSKNSDVSNKIMEFVGKATRPMAPKDIWKVVARDLTKLEDLMSLLSNLVTQDKLQIVSGAHIGYLVKRRVKKEPIFVDWSYLTPEERDDV